MRRKLSKLYVLAVPLILVLAGQSRPVSPPSTRPTVVASRPANPAATAPGGVRTVSANELLADFPKGASRLGKDERLVVEGTVVEVRQAIGKESPGMYVVINGTEQSLDNPAHITFAFTGAQPSTHLGRTVRVTGTFGGVDKDGVRIDLLKCENLQVLPSDSSPRRQFIGHWRSDLSLSASGLREWASRLGWTIDPNANGMASSPLIVDLNLKGDGTVEEEVLYFNQSLKQYRGTWEFAKKDGGEMLKFDLKGLPSFESKYKVLANNAVQIEAPGLKELNILPTAVLEGVYTRPREIDEGALQKQALELVRQNLGVPNPGDILKNTTNSIDRLLSQDRWFTLTYGSQLTKSGKAIRITSANGNLKVLEMTANQSTGHAPGGYSVGEMRHHFALMEPEVQLQSVVLDNKEGKVAGGNVTGKITVRALKLVPRVGYTLNLEYANGTTFFHMENVTLHLDSQTIPFTLRAPGVPADARENPMPVFFSISRMVTGNELASQVSNQVDMLLEF